MPAKRAAAVVVLAAVGGAAWVAWRRRSAPAGDDGIREIVVTAKKKPEPVTTPAASSGGVLDTLGRAVNAVAEQAAAIGRDVAGVFQPRGIRNNNPGNLRRTADKWQGLAAVQTDPEFFQFTESVWGIRALARVLVNYQSAGIRTVRGIVNRWAPPTENNTAAYVAAVARALGVGPDDPIDVRARLPELVPAIIRHENGRQPYPAELIADGIRRALGG